MAHWYELCIIPSDKVFRNAYLQKVLKQDLNCLSESLQTVNDLTGARPQTLTGSEGGLESLVLRLL